MRLGLWWSVYDYTSSSVVEFRARQARTRRYWVCVSPRSVLQAGPDFIHSKFLAHCLATGKGAPFGEGAPLWERACSLWLGGWDRACPFCKGRAPLRKGSFKVSHWKLNLLIQHTASRWCSSGCVHEGCGGVDRWLQTGDWSSQIFFYRQPTRQASTKCPLPALKQQNFWMQISSQLSRFPNSNNDHCDLGFRVTACDVVRRPYRGHEAASEDSMLKRVGGVCGPPMALVWGERMDQLMVQVEGGGSRPCGVEGESPCGDGRKLLVAVGRSSFRRARPFQEGRALFRGGAPLLLTW